MLESVLSKCLMHYLKEFIQPLDSEQMKIKVWKGSVRLTNLKMLNTALSSQHIPFRVKQGEIRSIHMVFPWKNLSAKHTVVEVQDILILLEPDGDVIIKSDLQARQEAIHQGETQKPVTKDDANRTLQNLLETVIDNLKISIKNIHIRIEIPQDDAIIALGFVIPEIITNTVDENDNTVQEVTHPDLLRKKLKISNISVYFDVNAKQINLKEFYSDMILVSQSKAHQFFLHPMSLNVMLYHRKKEIENSLKNQVDAIIEQIRINLDFSQISALLKMQQRWNQFQKIRKFAHCIRPQNYDDLDQFWAYAQRCAQHKLHPHVFKPAIALAILKYRNDFYKAYKRVATTKTPMPHQKQALERMEKKVGIDALLFLREYSDALVQKETKNDDTVLNALDLSELKGLMETTELFFSSNSYSMKMNVNSFLFEAVNESQTPLFTTELYNIFTMTSATKGGATMLFKLQDISIHYLQDLETKYVMQTFAPESQSFCSLSYTVSSSSDPSSTNIVVHPFKIILDASTLNKVLDFFTISNMEQTNYQEEVKVMILDLGEQLQSLQFLKNAQISLKLYEITYVFPFIDNNEKSDFKISISDINLVKESTGLIPLSAPSFEMNFRFHFTISSIFIDDFLLFSQDPSLISLNMGYVKGRLYIDFAASVELGDATFCYDNLKLPVICSAINNLSSLVFFQKGVYAAGQRNVIVLGRTTLTFKFNLHELSGSIQDGENPPLLIKFGDLHSDAYISLTSVDANVSLKQLEIDQFNQTFVEIIKPCIVTMNQENENLPLCVNMNLDSPHLIINFDTIDWLTEYFTYLANSISSYFTGLQANTENNNNNNGAIVSMEMNAGIFELPTDGGNFLIEIKRVSLEQDENDQTSLVIDSFSMGRDGRYLCRPFTIEVPINSSGPPKIHVNEITSELDPNAIQDLMPMSSKIYDMLFGHSDSPLKDIDVEIELTVSKGTGKCYNNDNCFAIADVYDLLVKIGLSNSLSIDVCLGKMNGYYTSNNSEFVDFNDQIHVFYKAMTRQHEASVSTPDGLVIVNQDLILWIMHFIPKMPPPEDPLDLKINAQVNPIIIKLNNDDQELLTVETGFISLNGFIAKDNIDMDLELGSIYLETNVILNKKIKVLDIGNDSKKALLLSLHDRMCNLSLAQIHCSLSLDYVLDLVGYFNSMNIDLPVSNNDFKLNMINFGVNFLAEGIEVKILGQTSTIQIDIPQIKFYLNSYYKIAALMVESVKLSSNMTETAKVVEISAILTFTDTFDTKSMTYDSIVALPTIGTGKQQLDNIFFKCSILEISFVYTHLFAIAVVDCFHPKPIVAKTNSHYPVKEIFQKLSIIPHVEMEINKINFTFYMLAPMATIIFSGIEVGYEGTWKGAVSKLDLIPSPEFSNNDNNNLINKFSGAEFLVFEIQRGECEVNLGETEFFIDYLLIISLAVFIMRSPLLRMYSPISKENLSKSQISNLTFPFTLKLQTHDLRIVIPTNAVHKSELLKINMNIIAELSPTLIDVDISDLSVKFSNPSLKYDFPTLLDNFSINFRMLTTNDGSFSVRGQFSDLILNLSVNDLILFVKIIDSIKETITSLVFTYETETQAPPLKFTKIQVHTSKIKVIICKDNRSSSLYIPIFSFKMLPIRINIARNKTSDTLTFNVQFMLKYYNEVTARWDLIFEPCKLQFSSCLKIDKFEMTLKESNSININIPLSIIPKIQDIKDSLLSNEIQYCEYPRFWIQNNITKEVTIHIENENYFVLEFDNPIPLFNVDLGSLITMKIDDQTISFRPDDIIYPTFMNQTIVVSRKTHLGGLLFLLTSPIQVENCLQRPLDLYIQNDHTKEYEFASVINSGKRYPIILNQGKIKQIVLTDNNNRRPMNHYHVSISHQDNSTIMFPVYSEKYTIPCIKTVYTDYSSSSKIISIIPAVVGHNQLPGPLSIMFGANLPVISMKMDQIADLPYVDTQNVQFTASFSLNGTSYGNKTSVKMKPKEPVVVPIYNDLTRSVQHLSIMMNTDKNTNQITLVFYTTCVFFNHCTFPIMIENSITINPGIFELWNRTSYLDRVGIYGVFDGKKERCIDLINCLEAGNSKIYFEHKELFVGVCVNVAITNLTSVITFTSMLKVTNNLDVMITIQPIEGIPQLFDDDYNLTSSAIFQGSPTNLEPGVKTVIFDVAMGSDFVVQVPGYTTTPAVSLSKPTKTVFRVQNQDTYKLIEIEVVDTGVGFEAQFNKVTFPTPITIANCLDIDVCAFHMVSLTPFAVEPESTSIFAFDEPFAYPSMHITFGTNHNFTISLVEDTEPVKMSKDYKGKPVFIQVKHNMKGNMMVIISQTIDEIPQGFVSCYTLELNSIYFSIIDFDMREFALVTLSNIKSVITSDNNGIVCKYSLGSLQVDDQNSTAQYPTIVYGRSTAMHSFIEGSFVCPPDSKPLSIFSYFSITLQRIDLMIDQNFLIDVITLTSSFTDTVHTLITAAAPYRSFETSQKLVTLNWFEISPIFLIFTYKKNTGRSMKIKKKPSFIGLVPGLSNEKMLVPGIMISQLTDSPDHVITMMSQDFKAAVFHQVIEMLGTKGTILKKIGVANWIASILHISMKSELTTELTQFSNTESENYDNRREIYGCLSHETMTLLAGKLKQKHDITPSTTIIRIITKKETGMKIRNVNGAHFGRGTIGVLTKASIDLLNQYQSMQGVLRARTQRALSLNHISVYDPDVASAQSLLEKTYQNEKIRITIRDKNSKCFICFSDFYMFVFTQNAKKLMNVVPFKDFINVSYNHPNFRIKMVKQTLNFEFNAEKEANELKTFIISQKTCELLFKSTMIQ